MKLPCWHMPGGGLAEATDEQHGGVMKGDPNTNIPRPRIYYDKLFDDLFKQTPKEVWLQYLEDGYTLHKAIKEERSQA